MQVARSKMCIFLLFLLRDVKPLAAFRTSRRIFDLLKDHKVLKWLEGEGGVLGFCERDALIMHLIADMIRKT